VAAQVAARGRLAALMAALKPSQLLLLQPNSEPPLVRQDTAAPRYTWSLAASCSTSAPISHQADLHLDAAKSTTAAAAGVVAQCDSALLCRQLQGCEVAQELMSGVCLGTPSQACCAVLFWAGYVCEVRHLGRWCTGELRAIRAAWLLCGLTTASKEAGGVATENVLLLIQLQLRCWSHSH
jgi:hypothetical protein